MAKKAKKKTVSKPRQKKAAVRKLTVKKAPAKKALTKKAPARKVMAKVVKKVKKSSAKAAAKAQARKRRVVLSKLQTAIDKRKRLAPKKKKKFEIRKVKEVTRVSREPEEFIQPVVPKKSKLKKAETDKIRKVLLEEKARILSQIKRLEKLSATDGSFRTADELPHHTMHIAEFASDNQAIDAAMSLRNIEEEHLTQIEESLDKLSRGDYGVCESCGKPIHLQRLLALPYTKLCLDCKKKLEQGGGF